MGNSAASPERHCHLHVETSTCRLVIHSDLTQEYKNATFELISDCYTTLVETFGSGLLTKFALTEDEFETVFCLVFDDPVEHFRQIWSVAEEEDDDEASQSGESEAIEEGTANVFHVFCALFLLCREQLHGMDSKIEGIYKLFDFDASGALNKVEVECLLQACATGLAQATGSQVAVGHEEIERMALEILAMGTEATLAMIKRWILLRRDVAIYLSDFLEARMVADYKHEVEIHFEATTEKFVLAARGEPPEISVDDLRAIIRALPGSPPTETEIDIFVAILDESGGAPTGSVGFDVFSDAMLPWISFSIVDDDATGTLSPDELKLLIWISAGEDGPEPSALVVQHATDAMDVNRDGIIVRLEWLKYNASCDPATGSLKFSRAARDLFRRMDTDGSSLVNTRELKETFQSAINDILTKLEAECPTAFSENSRLEIDTVVKEAADEVADLVDANADGIISWDEFAVHFDTITRKQDNIREYAKCLLNGDRTAGQHQDRRMCTAIGRVKQKSSDSPAISKSTLESKEAFSQF